MYIPTHYIARRIGQLATFTAALLTFVQIAVLKEVSSTLNNAVMQQFGGANTLWVVTIGLIILSVVAIIYGYFSKADPREDFHNASLPRKS